MNFYQEKTANFPRMETDKQFCNYDNSFSYNGITDKTIKFIENVQLLDIELWDLFVQQYRIKSDNGGTWKGEFWGKMMRGACFVYSYTKNEELYKILSNTVNDMLDVAETSGRISTYEEKCEFKGWDMWCRKYVLLGMQYFLEICNEEALKEKIVASMCRQTDYIIDKVGKEPDKISITATSGFWRGLNSSSILEPVVRLYSITNEEKYLNFAKYIVECGCTDIADIFNLAYKNEFYPYQYPVTKAYEMISCFEGLIEFYRITKNEKYKTAVINFADKILESDFTVIGCSGCTHELFDHSSVRQSNTTNGDVQQETCVTVTLMKFFYQMTLLTGDTKYIDAFEISLYNAYLGAVNFEKTVSPVVAMQPDLKLEAMPFDSYSPLTAQKRGNAVGGFQKIGDEKYYGCCACIGSAGIGLVPKMHIMNFENGFCINLFIDGTVKSKLPSGNTVNFETKTAYPIDGNVSVTITTEKPEIFEILIRNPAWSKNTDVCVCGDTVEKTQGYIKIKRLWKNGDKIILDFDMRTRVIKPVLYETDILMTEYVGGVDFLVPHFDKQDISAKNHIALQRGPIILAQDERLGYSLDVPADLWLDENNCVKAVVNKQANIPYETIVTVAVPLKDGSKMILTDYASAGKQKEYGVKIAAWLLIQ